MGRYIIFCGLTQEAHFISNNSMVDSEFYDADVLSNDIDYYDY